MPENIDTYFYNVFNKVGSLKGVSGLFVIASL